MIVSSIQVPSCALSKDLLNYINKCGLLGPSLLQPQSFTNDAFGTIREIIRASNHSTCMLHGVPIDMDEHITELFDMGLLSAFFIANDDPHETEILLKVLATFPANRVGVCSSSHISLQSLVSSITTFGQSCTSLSFTFYDKDSEELVSTLLDETKKQLSIHKTLNIYFQLPSTFTSTQIARVCSSHERIHVIVIPIIHSTINSTGSDHDKVIEHPQKSNTSSAIVTHAPVTDIVELFINTLRSDRPDGLFATVVCDEHDVCLGLVYSNAESIRTAIVEEKGVYWSRSRGGLWRKGDTSGMFQELLGIKVDCDNDALRFTVIQKGTPPAFCHLNTRTCWGHEHGLHKLQSILQDRLRSAPPGSYTKKLFDDPNFLQKKLLEEVQELVEATEPNDIAAEAADVMYFMMTRCVAGGVTLRDIEHHLDKRTLKVTRRPGLAKEWRTENAEKHLRSEKVESEDNKDAKVRLHVDKHDLPADAKVEKSESLEVKK